MLPKFEENKKVETIDAKSTILDLAKVFAKRNCCKITIEVSGQCHAFSLIDVAIALSAEGSDGTHMTLQKYVDNYR